MSILFTKSFIGQQAPAVEERVVESVVAAVVAAAVELEVADDEPVEVQQLVGLQFVSVAVLELAVLGALRLKRNRCEYL